MLHLLLKVKKALANNIADIFVFSTINKSLDKLIIVVIQIDI